ncbi:NUDIX hydrolase [Tuberibacillus sp. Marseille-P3662]|uniref:NUDIX hydrolase n=1 Tax=Tuberibacillus sp. Marseille-P3662 TaxID=1965358 RepID=UPI00111C352A|nr:CoA pyrophosphatase [Tuberibacillus sp. Marseille-P3662]
MHIETIKKQIKHQGQSIMGERDARKAAILIPLVHYHHRWHLLFEVRSLQLKSQPGDICFPGGKIESSDQTPEFTAIRETSEELGIHEHHIETIQKMDLYVPSSHLIVYPFVGIIHTLDYQINRDEVAETFTVPLDELLNIEPAQHNVDLTPEPKSDFPYHKLALGENYQWRKRPMTELFFDYKNYSIWGMTARILQYFLDELRKEPHNEK